MLVEFLYLLMMLRSTNTWGRLLGSVPGTPSSDSGMWFRGERMETVSTAFSGERTGRSFILRGCY